MNAPTGGGGPTTPGRGGRYVAPPLAELNIIPLVDVVLVILIIFLVTASFEKPDKPAPPPEPEFVLPLTLPIADAAADGAPAAGPAGTGETLVLGVDKEGRKYVGVDPVTTEVMRRRVREAAERVGESGRASVRIDADRDARYQDVVELVEMCRFERIRDVALHTSNKDE